MTTIHALFIGINQYPDVKLAGKAAFPPLTGCVADVTDFRNWLDGLPEVELRAVSLHDQAATKEKIIQSFRHDLQKAGSEDVALIYFSGHGTVEDADPIRWPDEEDGRLEGIVCYGDSAETSDIILADKELRYLLAELWQATQAHILCIFDCCHSGDNTRALAEADPADRPVQRRSYQGIVFPQRPWSGFLFADAVTELAAASEAIDDVLPPGRYIQLAASASNESALEVGGHGVFSTALLAELQATRADLTYEDLLHRVRGRLRFRYHQRPQMYTPPEALLERRGFLNRPAADRQVAKGRLTHEADGRYYIDRGALDGVQPARSEVTAAGKTGAAVSGQIVQTDLQRAAVSFADPGPVPAPQQVNVQNLYPRPLRLYLPSSEAPLSVREQLLDSLSKKEGFIIDITEAGEADYAVQLTPDRCYFSLPAEPYRPLARPIATSSENFSDTFEADLRHLFQYHYLFDLRNEAANTLPAGALSVQAWQADEQGNYEELPVQDGEILTDLFPGPHSGQRSLQIRIANQLPHDLYVAAVIFSFDFSVTARYLFDPPVAMLESGNKKYLRQHKGGQLKLQLDERCYWYNWPQSTDLIKFIISTAPFTVSAFEMPALSPPELPDKDRLGRERPTFPPLALASWNAVDIRLTARNPHFNQLPAADQALMQTGKEVAYFGNKLYGGRPTVDGLR